jgi:hypothetical protein
MYKINLVGVEEVKWDRGGTEPAADYTFFYGNKNHIYWGLDSSYIREYQQLRW